MQEKGQGRETPNNEKNEVTLKKYVIKWKFATIDWEQKQKTVYDSNEKSAIKQLYPYNPFTDEIISINVFNVDDNTNIKTEKDEATELLTVLDNTKNIDEIHQATANLVNFVKRITGID